MIERNLYLWIDKKEYKNKMRFIAGPRQSGKTTLVKYFLQQHKMNKLYFNWDRREIRTRYYNNAYFYNDELYQKEGSQIKWICFDEIHKMPKWKDILKDIYDTDNERFKLIITGSARLDLFRQSGDSLAGRYYLFHLLPLSLSEVTKNNKMKELDLNSLNFIENTLSMPIYFQKQIDNLLKFSGFPEPFTEQKENILRMWQNNYLDSVLKEDIQELSGIKNLENVAKLMTLLPTKIGAPLSINSLTRDIEVSYQAIKNYLYALELTYLIFKIKPYSKKISKAIKKEKKYYLFDWTKISDPSIRFENYIAFELLNFVTFLKDHGYGNFELSYIRTRNGEETDFLITLENKPWLLFEVKLNNLNISNHNNRHALMLGDIPLIQIVYKNEITTKKEKNIFVVSASRFFSNLY